MNAVHNSSYYIEYVEVTDLNFSLPSDKIHTSRVKEQAGLAPQVLYVLCKL